MASEPEYPSIAYDPEASGWLADLAQNRISKMVVPAARKPGFPLKPFGVHIPEGWENPYDKDFEGTARRMLRGLLDPD